MTTDIFFKSEGHQERLIEALQNVEHQDVYFTSALYILTADLATWQKAEDYVEHDSIDFEQMLSEIDFSSGYIRLINLAWNLFNEHVKVNVVDLMGLDERNFNVAIQAIQLRRRPYRLTEIRGEGKHPSGTLSTPGEQAVNKNEQMIRACIDELKARKLALIPSSVAELIRQNYLDFEGDYNELSLIVWRILNDPIKEQASKRMIESDNEE